MCKQAGVKKYPPYSLRHSWSTYVEIADPADRMLLMGHSNYETSFSYVSANDSRHRKIMDKASKEFEEMLNT